MTDYYSWTGTMDPSAYLAVPAAIQFQRDNDWPTVREICHARAVEVRNRIQALTGLTPICPDDRDGGYRWFEQMFTAPLPMDVGEGLRERLWEEHKIEVPVGGDERMTGIRVSIQAYNTQEDVDRLMAALEAQFA